MSGYAKQCTEDIHYFVKSECPRNIVRDSVTWMIKFQKSCKLFYFVKDALLPLKGALGVIDDLGKFKSIGGILL